MILAASKGEEVDDDNDLEDAGNPPSPRPVSASTEKLSSNRQTRNNASRQKSRSKKQMT